MSMPTAMSQMKATANAHMKRDMEVGRKWICACESCREMRSLVGVNKLLDVRPLLRELEQIEEQLRDLPDGPEMSELLEQYLELHDRLADVMAK
jgi:hypothetical protein